MSKKYLKYVAGEPDHKAQQWVDLREFQFELEPGEFTLIWAAHVVRTKYLEAAEKVFPNYNHPEPFNIGGKKTIVEIKSALSILKNPILVGCPATGTEKPLIDRIKTGELRGDTWRVKEDAGLQIIASIGWFCDMAKAKQPPITKSTSDLEYSIDLLPTNMGIKDEEAPSGYNQKQTQLMEETRETMTLVLKDIPALKTAWLECPIVTFGQKVFKVTSKIFTSLPDPEDEERKKFEEMKAKATAEPADPDDDP